ncbi:hypothetical protein ACJ41O_010181 [Fusarium nematophilum]
MSKFEPSPAESLLSIPGDPYPSLFDNTALTPAAATTMSPLDIDVDMDMMTPQSFAEPEDTAVSPPTAEAEAEPSNMSSPAPGEKSTPGKKPAKKRKSWGQVLPQPKTNLPPRKRAKTEDEKEQRRVERVLRNRRAAQSSRERKRLEVEALETRNKELELTVLEQQKKLMALVQQLHRIGQSPAIVTSSPLDSIPETSLTLSKELFGSKDKLIASDTPPVTVNPASLSPNLVPVADSSEKVSPKKESVKKEPSTDAAPSEPTSSISPDLTQLVPGVANLDSANLGLAPAASDDAAFSLGSYVDMSSTIDTDRYLLEGQLLASPNSSAFGDDYLVDNPPSYGLFNDNDFDFNDYLYEDGNLGGTEPLAASHFTAATRGLEHKVHDSETRDSSEDPIQQPLPGASAYGCDAGGIAVGL